MNDGSNIAKVEKHKIAVDKDVYVQAEEIARDFGLTPEDVFYIVMREYGRNPRAMVFPKQRMLNLYMTAKSALKFRKLQQRLGTTMSGVFRLMFKIYRPNIEAYLNGRSTYINRDKFKASGDE
jgi:antitoxin component of RelBE/YafQ-DinJ toxin-antitoxin module